MNSRLKFLRKYLKLTQPEFGKLCGKSRDAIATYESGRVIPDDAFFKVVCLTFNVNEEWLRTGTGEMFSKSNTDDFLEQMIKKYNLSPVEAQIADYCLNLSSEERAGILKHILNIANIIQHNNSINSINIQDTKLTKEEKLKILSKQLDDEEKGKILEVSTGING